MSQCPNTSPLSCMTAISQHIRNISLRTYIDVTSVRSLIELVMDGYAHALAELQPLAAPGSISQYCMILSHPIPRAGTIIP